LWKSISSQVKRATLQLYAKVEKYNIAIDTLQKCDKNDSYFPFMKLLLQPHKCTYYDDTINTMWTFAQNP
jgi:hypothetical protein